MQSPRGGHVNAYEKERINKIFKKGFKYGYLQAMKDFDTIVHDADSKMFRSIMANSNHPLYPLLPPPKPNTSKTRPKGHGLTLPSVSLKIQKIRTLFVVYCRLYRPKFTFSLYPSPRPHVSYGSFLYLYCM